MIAVPESLVQRHDVVAPGGSSGCSQARPGEVHFADLIAPVSVEDFFGHYWERQPLHVRAGSEVATGGLFSLQQLDHLLARLPAAATVRLARASDDGSTSQLAQSDTSDLPSLYERFGAGDTIIVDRMQVLWEPIAGLCRNLMVDIGMQIQANLYVTPRHAAGFACHWDGHDTLILQLEGRKVWSVFRQDGTLPHPSSDGDRHQPAISPDLEVTMQPGDVLYLPRGTPHQARTSEEASVHLTVGLIAATWRDLLVANIESLVPSHPELHQSLPQGWLGDSQHGAGLSRRCRDLVRQLSTDRSVDAGLELLAAQLIEGAPFLPDGHFVQVSQLDLIDRETVVSRRSPDPVRPSRRGSQARLSFPGSFVAGPAKLFWAFDFIAGSARFVVGDIPGWYSDAERIMIAKVLVSAGCLRIVSPASSTVRGVLTSGALE